MQEGREPRCLMDFWSSRCLEEMAEAEAAGVAAPEHTTDAAMADTVMDFLFASQDASTASLVWMMCLMADHPKVLAKARACRHPARCVCSFGV
jgi:sterol 22-desaturase